MFNYLSIPQAISESPATTWIWCRLRSWWWCSSFEPADIIATSEFLWLRRQCMLQLATRSREAILALKYRSCVHRAINRLPTSARLWPYFVFLQIAKCPQRHLHLKYYHYYWIILIYMIDRSDSQTIQVERVDVNWSADSLGEISIDRVLQNEMLRVKWHTVRIMIWRHCRSDIVQRNYQYTCHHRRGTMSTARLTVTFAL